MKKYYLSLGLIIMVITALGQSYLVPEEGYRVASFLSDYKAVSAFDIYENLIFMHDGDTIHQVDIQTGEVLKKFGKPSEYDMSSYVSFLTVSPDGKSIWTGYTSDGNGDDRIYRMEVASGTWIMQARFPGNFDLAFWNNSILVSGLNSASWGDPSGIFLLDTTGTDQHRKIIEVGGNSAGMAIDTSGNLYYGTSFFAEPNALHIWRKTQLAAVIGTPGSQALQISDGQKLSDVPAGVYDCETDGGGNLVFNMNLYGSTKVLARWNNTSGDGYNLDTLAVATGETDWLGTLKTIGEYTRPEIGNMIVTSCFGQTLVDLHTADYPPVLTESFPVMTGYENMTLESIDLTQYVDDPDGPENFDFQIVMISNTDVADLSINGNFLSGTLGKAGQANIQILAANASGEIDHQTVIGVWPEISGEHMVSDFEDLALESGDYWNGEDGSGEFVSALARFHNSFDPDWFSWSGWAYSSVSDQTTPGWMNQYSAITGEGFEGSDNYGVSYPSTPSVIDFTLKKAHMVKGLFVTNATYAALSMKHGDAFTKKFGGEEGTDPDFFRLDIWGFRDGTGTDTIEYFLADFRSEASSMDYINRTWQWVDLTSLGKIDSLQFALTSSDVGDWGMNTPGYFCMDNLYVIPDEAPFVANPIPDLIVLSDGSDAVIDITHVFSDPDDDDEKIIKTIVSNSQESILEASVEGNELILRSKLQLLKSLVEEIEVVLEGNSGALTITDTIQVTLDFPGGINGQNELGIGVFPNPSHGSIVIESGTSESLDVTIISITGARVYINREFIPGQTIDLSNVPAGPYILKIRRDSGVIGKMIQKL